MSQRRREREEDYLKHYNHGRGFVLIGHSRGSGGAHVLEITPRNGAQTPTPEWGPHLLDANVAQGNLLSIINDERWLS